MNVLAIESSTRTPTIAIVTEGRIIEYAPCAGADAVLTVATVVEALACASVSLQSLDAIAFGSGPGAFTSLRSACSIALGLGLARGLPVVPVSSLRALAEPHLSSGELVVALDARLGEVYWARVSVECTLDAEPRCSTPEVLRQHLQPGDRALGNGFGAHEAVFGDSAPLISIVDSLAVPKASAVARLAMAALAAGETFELHDLAPDYVRNKVAMTKVEQLAVRRLNSVA
ncbi:tRNA (adenosine(37)-N6)-threonylcarbamoyltransferase complex dimerization subunit type 1 TsaB [Niveibacterium sp. 24ML]|uniref:tRNA (adenosine(37)-N6)-threonylcarbamoyltransferase complex dimerization subunit type 1 TsaB n=1 Tax=Niveibacterium sp. 24ML TaxID=2985512 RepID=UPI00226FB864|nr:tRNA (adenosine(37)-N6)-threonylcarbamoyltransferase complex dimerization subunit type 1 TsaB [Niveibacterium sp. 24ML]MCX9157096.1 tRNA (adenosine(37)-N6)-threonylcarbamoyltransferase complex dimerization subunit type 1 TsaB [Niveibacterium sp. 24ML]